MKTLKILYNLVLLVVIAFAWLITIGAFEFHFVYILTGDKEKREIIFHSLW